MTALETTAPAGRRRKLPPWFFLADTAGAGLAGALWYLWPDLGAWPLLPGLLPWLVRLLVTGRLTRRTPYDLPLLIFLMSAGLAVWSSYDRPVAWPKFWLVVGAILIFYAFANARLADRGQRLLDAGVTGWQLRILTIFGAALALYFIFWHDYEALPAKIGFLNRLGQALQAPLPRLPGHRLHPNVAGGLLALTAPFVAAFTLQAWQRRRWLWLVSALLALGLVLLALLLTTSRGAWVALAVAGSTWLWWELARVLATLLRSSRRRVFLAGLILGGAVGLLLLSRPAVAGRLANALPGPGTGQSRYELFRDSITLADAFPYIGAGLDSFMSMHSSYVLLTHVDFIVHSHNIYLNLAIEQGLPGLLALLWLGFIFMRGLWRDSSSGRPALILEAAALSLLVTAVHGLVDDALYGSRGLLLMFLPLTLTLPTPAAISGRRRPTWQLRAVLAGALLLLAIIFWRPLLSHWHSNLAAIRQNKAELSRYHWPEWSVQDELRRAIDLEPVIAGYERALAIDPGNPTANRRLGQIELSLGRYESALTHLEAAYAAWPGDNGTRQLLGEAYLVNDRPAEALALWADVNDDQQQLELRAFWYNSIGESATAAQIRTAISNLNQTDN